MEYLQTEKSQVHSFVAAFLGGYLIWGNYNKVNEQVRFDIRITVNTPTQYTVIFHGLKNDYFEMKNCNIFLIFAHNIDCGYMLEPPH